MGQDTVSDKRVGAVRSTDGMGPLENRDPKEPAEYLVVRWPSWLPKTFRSSWLASVVVAAYVVLFLVSLVRSPYFGPLATVDEQLMYYQVARTFNEHGFLNSAFLQDFSSSSNPDHHPFVYNHMPPGPELFTSLLMKVFGEQFQLIRVVFVAIFVVGVAYYLKFVSLLLDRLALRGAGFALLLIPPYVMLHTVDHPAYSPFPFIGFFPLVAFDHYHRTGRRRWYWGALLVVLIGSLYLVYQQLFMLFASWALLGLLRVIRLERREVLTLLFTGGLGIVLHLLQSVILLGPQTFAEELGLTISNRMFGVPTTGELRAFYQTIAVVHQGFHQLDPQMLWDILRRSVRPAGERQLKDLVLALMAGGLILALLRSVPLEREQASIRIRRGEVTQALHLLSMSLLWVLGAVIIPLLMFPAYAASYQLSGANHFLLAAVAILGVSYAATESVRLGQRWIRRAEPRSWRWMASLGVLGLVLTALIAFGNTVIREQTRQFRERMQHVFRDGRQKELFELVEPLRGAWL